MNKAFEKILERLDEELRKSEERYYRYLDDSNLPCMFDKSDIEEKRVDTIKEMLEIVQEVAEKYNGGWIPCSERLPNQGGEFTDVLITCESMEDGVFVQSAEFYISSYGEPIFDTLYHHERVLAWQPLPEPFKERD